MIISERPEGRSLHALYTLTYMIQIVGFGGFKTKRSFSFRYSPVLILKFDFCCAVVKVGYSLTVTFNAVNVC